MATCLHKPGQAQQRIRQEQQRFILGHQPPQMMAGQMSQYQNQLMMRNMQNGMNMGQSDMARTAMQNSRKSYVEPPHETPSMTSTCVCQNMKGLR
jgi:hypothetical protein